MADDSQREDRGKHCVRITLPDGREFRFFDDSGVQFQDVLMLTGRDGVWKNEHGFIPVTGCICTERDVYEFDVPEFASRAEALTDGLQRARELGVPLIEQTCRTEEPPAHVSLFQPTQVIVSDRLGEVTFTVRGSELEPECDDLSDEVQAVREIVVGESMTQVALSAVVRSLWGAACTAKVRPMPVLNPAVKGVRHE